MRWLDEIDANEVLDVGSGRYGLSCFRPGRVVQTDLSFGSNQPPKKRLAEPIFQVASVERLPFEDGTFDAAISLDMMEHLPDHLRSIAIAEMARVSRRAVIVGCPIGVSAMLVDLVFAAYLRLRRQGYPLWLAEHREQTAYPTVRQLLASTPDDWFVDRQRGSGNVLLVLAVHFAEHFAASESNHFMPGLRRTWRWPRALDAPPCYRQIVMWRRISDAV